ncbi:S-formylglutathione hydrolase [Synechococcus sp. PCC 7502]|uniref:S-formylglutathione hydrolase n=1 Tax=Synechococcus sp. PCC 7502 TaxID=1173263 RepID=UPI00029FA453|nr:S-formylglutathione hydrolase [Synechococcus sp. PCC 7502]AFY72328.1 S-formylglutathione hydrolase [Synechococcus sp. PCC 7502]
MTIKLLSEHLSFGGKVGFYSHFSEACHHEMRFSIYLPPQAQTKSVPVLYFLSGLTCTEEVFMAKAGAQKLAAEYGLILVVPDTSPRNTGIIGENQDWDLGSGAGFYVDATQEPWRSHYQMYSYVTSELPTFIHQNFPTLPDRQGIFGHSMGGHGALVCALRNPEQYQSVSVFAAIAAPSQCPWGQKAFTNYLGQDQTTWQAYDATELVKYQGFPRPILFDQGTADTYLKNQLFTEAFLAACELANQPLILRYQEGYDHGFYFVSTFIADHIRHHAEALYAIADKTS